MLLSLLFRRRSQRVSRLLTEHFGKDKLPSLVVSDRQFPLRVRADLQRAMDGLIADSGGVRHFCGLRTGCMEETDIGALVTDSGYRTAVVAPPEYEEIDIGEERPVRCLKAGLWLMGHRDGGERFCILMAPAGTHCVTGVRFQIGTLAGASGTRLVEDFFKALETAVRDARSYRGKILSLERGNDYTGQSTGIKVHKLRLVEKDQVILPRNTLELLERNVIAFVQRREKLAAAGQATKKGLLFYGPPGTGKSHTIHYLARALHGHTLLLITAEQVALLGEYMALARLLQPSVVVIEDVDLIARDRTTMHTPGEELLLNKLLNEMDGLKEQADILFILTTNRPEALEKALASRPGRIDQAIEFPLPDAEGREKLVRLYGRGTNMADEVVETIVRRTEHVSAAFIKELIRRAVQFQLERDGDAEPHLTRADVDNALDELLFRGGSLNVKLLGGAAPADHDHHRTSPFYVSREMSG